MLWGIPMADWVDQAVLGIVVGVLTSAVLWGLKSFFDKVIDPAIRARLYSGVDLSGQWYGSDQSETQPLTSEVTCNLKQSAQAVSGTLRMQYASPEKSFELDFDVTGHIWEGYITLNLRPSDKRVTSYACCLLKVVEGGVKLRGVSIYRSVSTDEVEQMPWVLVRGSAASYRQHLANLKSLQVDDPPQSEGQAAAEEAPKASPL